MQNSSNFNSSDILETLLKIFPSKTLTENLLNLRLHLAHKARYTLTKELNDFLNDATDIISNHTVLFKAGHTFCRARMGGKLNKYGHIIEPYSNKDMGAPNISNATQGRANVPGIPALYLGSTAIVCIAELKPHRGAKVSVAKHRVKKNISLVDLRIGSIESRNLGLALGGFRQPPTKNHNEFIKSFCLNFSLPVDPMKANIDYCFTQIFAEKFKLKGLDGICYSSLFTKNYLNDFNIVLFDTKATSIVNNSKKLWIVKNIEVEAKPCQDIASRIIATAKNA